MLNLNDVYFFVQAVDSQGFAPASRRLGIPKSTLSKRVAALEAELGVRLIQRSSRRFVLTEIGQDFHRHAAAMLIEAEAAEHVVKGRLAEPSGVVRITSSVPTAQLMLADVVVEAARLYPKLRIVVHATDRFVDIVQEGYDIAVRDHFNPLPDSDLVQRRVAYDPVYLIASPAHLQQKGEPREPADLAAHDALSTTPGSAVWKLENEAGERVEVQVPARFTADESTVLLRAAG
jgi:DNA-binding transcriptional LysR family regulator